METKRNQIELSGHYKEGDWNNEFIDQLVNFTNAQLHDDLVDALAYIDQIQVVDFMGDYEEEEFEVIDMVSGY